MPGTAKEGQTLLLCGASDGKCTGVSIVRGLFGSGNSLLALLWKAIPSLCCFLRVSCAVRQSVCESSDGWMDAWDSYERVQIRSSTLLLITFTPL